MTKMNTYQNLIEKLDSNNIDNLTLSISKDQNIINIKTEVVNSTKFLDDIQSVKIGFRVYCIRNGITEIPKCYCGSNCVPNKADNNKGFTKYCSDYCKKHAPQISQYAIDKLQDRDWLFEKRIVEKLSYLAIGNLIGTSEQPVKQWCNTHQIPTIRYNESQSTVKTYLENKDWLYEQHVVKHRKISDIADEIGSSKSTVSIWIRQHGIPTNETNSYPRNNDKISSECMEVIDYIHAIYDGEVIYNERTLLNGIELDIYIPEKKLAIEYNGIYSHIYRPHEDSYSRIKDASYHVGKTNRCEELGIQLLQFWSCQWQYKRSIVESILAVKLGVTPKRVYARQCTIKEIDVSTKNTFLDNNHLQGRDRATVKLGLFHSDELVAVMTFSPARYNKECDWELMRFSVKAGMTIPGGFSKLLKHFRKDYNGSIVSYADRMYSNGNVYQKNGFELTHINNPAYWYVDKKYDKLEHRAKFRKSRISTGSDDRTEKEIMEANGYFRIWDCGTMTFILK